jgi:hypothetical protein
MYIVMRKAVAAPPCLDFGETLSPVCGSSPKMGVTRVLTDRSRVLDFEEANQLLPQVRTLVARIRRRVALRQRLASEMLVLQVVCDSCNGSNPDFQEYLDKKVRYHRLGGQVDALVDRLTGFGCVVRDRDATWVDFTFMREDGLAVLCWRHGEDSVSHWHFMHESHADRRLVPSEV